jgi:hypothetical protein
MPIATDQARRKYAVKSENRGPVSRVNPVGVNRASRTTRLVAIEIAAKNNAREQVSSRIFLLSHLDDVG